jgi:hypothetical protein
VTIGLMSSGMSSMNRVRVRSHRCSPPPQHGQASSRCSAFWSMVIGAFRRDPLWPGLAPGVFRRRLSAVGFS